MTTPKKRAGSSAEGGAAAPRRARRTSKSKASAATAGVSTSVSSVLADASAEQAKLLDMPAPESSHEGRPAVAPERPSSMPLGRGLAEPETEASTDTDAGVRRPQAVLPTRRLRRHRSGVGLPALLPPADIPDDAEGRVEFIAVTPPPDVVAGVDVEELDAEEVVDATEPLGHMETAIGAVTRGPIALLMRGGVAGWAPVALLAVMFVVVFLVGMRLAK